MRTTPFFTDLMGDAAGYDEWAHRIVGGDWLGQSVFYQAPLYPYLLACLHGLVGHDLLAVRVVQACLSSGAIVLVALSGRRLFGPRAGAAAGLLLALLGPSLFFDGLVQKSSLDFILMSGLIGVIAHSSRQGRRLEAWAFLAGLILGCLILSRENALGLVPILGAWSWRRGPSGWNGVGAFGVGLALLLSPVVVRNYVLSSEVHLTTSQMGPNLYIGNHEGATGTYSPLRPGRGNVRFEEIDAKLLAEVAEGRSLRPAEVSKYWTGRALDWIVRNPGGWLKLMGRKLALALNAVEWTDTEDLYTHAEWSWVLRVLDSFMHFGVLIPLAVLGLWITRPRWKELWVFYLLMVAYTLSLMAFYVVARYRFPLAPLLALFAGVGLADAPRTLRANPGERLPALVLLGAAAIVCNWPLQSKHSMRSLTHANLAETLHETGHSAEAIAEFRRALELDAGNVAARTNLGALLSENGERTEALNLQLEAVRADPQNAAAQNNLGRELALRGEIAEAIHRFQRSIELDPMGARAHYNLALVLASTGRSDEALREFEEAIRWEPRDGAAHNNLGILLASLGRLAEAEQHFRIATELRPDLVEAAENLAHAQEIRRSTTPTGPKPAGRD